MTRALWGLGSILAGVVTLAFGLALADTEVDAGSLQWHRGDDGCQATDSTTYNKELTELGAQVFTGITDRRGCVTTRYLEPNYDSDCQLGICSDVHAGIDLRAMLDRNPRSDPNAPLELPAVYAVDGGTVIVKSFEPENGHSTLIILSGDGTRKVLYLHMSEIFVGVGDGVYGGMPIGRAGSIGTGSPHLHIEVWPSTSPWFNSRNAAISGSACKGKVCTLAEVARFTIDPVTILRPAAEPTTSDPKSPILLGPRPPPPTSPALLMKIIHDVYSGGGVCAKYFPLQDITIIKETVAGAKWSAIALLAVNIEDVPTADQIEVSFCFGGGFQSDPKATGQTKHLLAQFDFEPRNGEWAVSYVGWDPVVNGRACFCPWIFVEDRMRVCGCSRPY